MVILSRYQSPFQRQINYRFNNVIFSYPEGLTSISLSQQDNLVTFMILKLSDCSFAKK